MSEITVNVSTAALAYLGDCVMERCVRRFLVSAGLSTSRHLNKASLDFVKAGAQAQAYRNIADILTEEEAAVFRRGRNTGHGNVPKSASVTEYRQATGLEAVFGFLDLEGREERITELFERGYADKISAVNEKMKNNGYK